MMKKTTHVDVRAPATGQGLGRRQAMAAKVSALATQSCLGKGYQASFVVPQVCGSTDHGACLSCLSGCNREIYDPQETVTWIPPPGDSGTRRPSRSACQHGTSPSVSPGAGYAISGWLLCSQSSRADSRARGVRSCTGICSCYTGHCLRVDTPQEKWDVCGWVWRGPRQPPAMREEGSGKSTPHSLLRNSGEPHSGHETTWKPRVPRAAHQVPWL